MITEIIFFKLTPDVDHQTLMERYLSTAVKWAHNPDLIQKYYYYDAATHEGGGVYIWRTREAAARWHDDQYKAMVEKIYGHPPVIRVLDALIHVDATQNKYEVIGESR
ncbi:YdhR family protein [Paraburkholderia sp. D15]|uniref:YdhR family protein n=1 Tax=Paraburkholderia sp. D15 TaxID=2880218 RepID=UPI00247889D6|nr:YdhR family protein [Paraburkholderia sp. D15]WGS54158.1 YdhR family protein [Paraburkholderia sp. D15]